MLGDGRVLVSVLGLPHIGKCALHQLSCLIRLTKWVIPDEPPSHCGLPVCVARALSESINLGFVSQVSNPATIPA